MTTHHTRTIGPHGLDINNEEYRAMSEKQFNPKGILPLEVGGPYPSVSIITCVDGGSFGQYDAPEPPIYECVAVIHQAQDPNSEQPALAVQLAEWMVKCCNAHAELQSIIVSQRETIHLAAGKVAELLAACKAAFARLDYLDCIFDDSFPTTLRNKLNAVIASVEGGVSDE